MATNTLPKSADRWPDLQENEDSPALLSRLPAFLRPLASLKLTVVLLAMAIFIVLVGTLAQARSDTWDVVRDYFRIEPRDLWLNGFPWINLGACFARIEFQTFFPPSFFPDATGDAWTSHVPGFIYFPKGWLIGLMMGVNLLAAHAIRFKVQASGTRLSAGLAVLSAGVLVTYLVIRGGSNPEGFQGKPLIDYGTLWHLMQAGLVLLFFGVFAVRWRIAPTERLARSALMVVGVFLGALIAYLFAEGDASQLSDPSMRILWQLVQGGLAGLVLLAGCALVFKKRAGIVLLHGGIGLLMFSELLVGTTAVESQMAISEGETVNYVFDTRSLELTITDPSPADYDQVTVVPISILKQGALTVTKKVEIEGRPDVKVDVLQAADVVRHDDLPFNVALVEYLPNALLRLKQPGDEPTPATAGVGLQSFAEPRRPGAGADSGGGMDVTAAYVTLLDKHDGHPIATYLVSPYLKDQKVEVDGKPYWLSLQFKRTAKPYSLRLIDIRKNDYTGTNTPRDYSSYVQLVDPTRNVDREVRIWMNNPLRFAGETFYQSGYHRDENTGQESTTLSVVSNTGWMIPYVACMIVATGMLAQFLLTLSRFLNRQTAPSDSRDHEKSPARAASGKARWVVPTVVVALAATVVAYDVYKATQPREIVPGMRIDGFAQLPVLFEGRFKPMETLARNTLRIISNKQSFVGADGKRVTAIEWMLDVISDSPAATDHPVFRIDNPELLAALKIEPRASNLYSLAEIQAHFDEFDKQIKLAHAQQGRDKHSLTLVQRKVLELETRVRTYMQLYYAFSPLPVSSFLTPDLLKDPQKAQNLMSLLRLRVAEMMKVLNEENPPLAVAVALPAVDSQGPSVEWQTYTEAVTKVMLQYTESQITRQPPKEMPSASTVAFLGMLSNYKDHKAEQFNQSLQEYRAALAGMNLDNVDLPKIHFETFFDRAEPFWWLAALYVLAFVVAAGSWLGANRPLNRAAFCLLAFIFLLHTAALIGRIYISGRPPVTNLYSSAVFIGWGCVALGLGLELVYRLGIGNLIAAVAGFGALGIAHLLTTEVPTFRGDTFTVLQAVLDTQFWLATHVVCITLGYATTFVAGNIAQLYLLMGMLTTQVETSLGKAFSRMIYGSICFALFFSFVGTVLGGLWADDSWGRFWGWDPKENGALIIVLWNALLLHARWGGWVKARGLAVLAVGGNIVTAWSWFGVNELGIGLHSYGFTDGVLMWLAWFIMSQLLIIAVAASIPQRKWRSSQDA